MHHTDIQTFVSFLSKNDKGTIRMLIAFCLTPLYILRYGLGVRIAGSHPAGPGSIPGNGILFSILTLLFLNYLLVYSKRVALKCSL